MRLKDKIAVISAGASGMGRAGAILFANEGAIVNILDIDEKNAYQVVQEIKENGGEANFFKTDMTNLSDIEATFGMIKNKYGRIDVLWNHVGIPGPSGIENVEENEFDLAMMLNFKSSFFSTKYAIPLMKEAGGSIIFTSSTSGIVGSPWSPVYSAAKGAVTNVARALAANLGEYNIRVNAVCPGQTETPMLKKFLVRSEEDDFETNKRMFLSNIPLKRAAQPTEIANAALFLASNESSYITGVNLPVDGGFTAK